MLKQFTIAGILIVGLASSAHAASSTESGSTRAKAVSLATAVANRICDGHGKRAHVTSEDASSTGSRWVATVRYECR